jgi:hypothetical protein
MSVAEIEAAGAVEGFFRGAGGHAGGQDLVLILAAAGQVKGLFEVNRGRVAARLPDVIAAV